MLKKCLQSAPIQALIAHVAAWYLAFVGRSTRWRIEEGALAAALAAGPPRIVIFWHESLPVMPVLRQRGMPARRAVVLASRHRDGQLIGRVVGWFGIGVVSGSTSRGGAAGLRGLAVALRAGADVGLTPDGPRGPRRVAARGVAMLAAMSGAEILPCAASTQWGIGLNTWDGMRLPLPFGRGRLSAGPPIRVARDGWAEALPVIEAALNAACARAAMPTR